MWRKFVTGAVFVVKHQSPLFSIIIPAYNYAHTLPRAVESVLNQPGDDYELLVVNDGSTDDTAGVLEQLQDRFGKKLNYYNKENGGLASTRNFGIDHSCGTYLIFLDADDEMVAGALHKLGTHIEANPETRMVVGGHYSCEKGQDTKHKAAPVHKDPLLRLQAYLLDKKLSISNGATAMHRDVFSQYRYPEHFRNCEDVSMFAYVLANFSCTALDFPVARIYKHGDSLRHNTQYASSIGTSLIAEVFDPSRIPENLQVLKEPYSAQRNLSLFRTFFLAGNYAKALTCYFAAWQHNDELPRKWNYRKKAIQASFFLLIGKKPRQHA
ncbi:glycosyltransferase family 2 protein [Endozoicomonadaceae bacterium StTr2]